MRLKFLLLSLIVCSVFGLSGCVSGALGGGEYIRKDGYHVYVPKKSDEGRGLILTISPGGEAKSAENSIKEWEKFADKNNFVVVSPINWSQKTILSSLNEVKKEYKTNKTIFTGFSNGGYNSCYFALSHLDVIDAVIPMGAYCKDSDVKTEINKKIPILVVVGENDVWARGEDFSNIDEATAGLKKIGFIQEKILVPGAGHSFLISAAMDKIEKWILDLPAN